MRKIIIPILLLAFVATSAYVAFDSWAGLASNQTISRAALQNGISTGALARAGAIVPSDSERNVTIGEVGNYIYCNLPAKSGLQLAVKSDITPLNDSAITLWANSGVITSVTSACQFRATGTSLKAHYASPLAVNSYMITSPSDGDAFPQYLYNAADSSIYKWNASGTIDSIVSCGTGNVVPLSFVYEYSTANGYRFHISIPVTDTLGTHLPEINIQNLHVFGMNTSCVRTIEADTSFNGTLLSPTVNDWYVNQGIQPNPITTASPNYQYYNAVTINGVQFGDLDRFRWGGQIIEVHLVLSCTSIPTVP